MTGSVLPAPRSLLVAALVCSIAAIPAFARVGEPLARLKERFGRPPEAGAPKNMAVWIIESIDGALIYTVTLNAKGISIAEGIKPLKRGLLTTQIAQDFLRDQTFAIKDSKTARVVPAGEKYTFAKQPFVCGANESVVVDDTNGLLIIWSRDNPPSVMAVTREMLLRAGG
jgi:hypothetical protein